jgi:hypothetical protein
MNNDALARAIEFTNSQVHKCATAEPRYQMLTEHLSALLATQRRRAELAQQPAQPGWSPSSGQLPPIQTRVLCMDDREHCEVDMWWGPDFNFGWPYWMPLPTAPKQGDKP